MLYSFTLIETNNYTKITSESSIKRHISELDDYIEHCIRIIKNEDCSFKIQINKHVDRTSDESIVVEEIIIDKDYVHKPFEK